METTEIKKGTKMLGRIKKLFQKKIFKPGDRVVCPICGVVFTLVKFQGDKWPKGYHAMTMLII